MFTGEINHGLGPSPFRHHGHKPCAPLPGPSLTGDWCHFPQDNKSSMLECFPSTQRHSRKQITMKFHKRVGWLWKRYTIDTGKEVHLLGSTDMRKKMRWPLEPPNSISHDTKGSVPGVSQGRSKSQLCVLQPH